MKKTLLLLTALLSITFSACYYDKEELMYGNNNPGSCDTTNVTYSGVIAPMVTASCAISGCHNNATTGGGYDFTTYAGFVAVVNNGRLMGSINHESGFSAMPKGMNKMDDCNLAKVKAWVNSGAPNN